MFKAIGRGESLRIEIRVAESYLGFHPSNLRRLKIEDLIFVKKDLMAKVREKMASSEKKGEA